MIGSVVNGLAAAMTVAALSFSIASPPADGGSGSSVAVSGSQVVVVVDGDTPWVRTSVEALGCPPSTGRPAVGPGPATPLLGLQRMLCALPTAPADVTRLAFPRTLPWLGLMHF